MEPRLGIQLPVEARTPSPAGELGDAKRRKTGENNAMNEGHSSFPPKSAASPVSTNPCPQLIPPPLTDEVSPVDGGGYGEKYAMVMVGLPARGKTHIAKRLSRYLSFFHGAKTKVFNAGDYRRSLLGAKQTSDFYDHAVPANVEMRQQCCDAALKDLQEFLRGDHKELRIGFFDATNSTKERRKLLLSNLHGVADRVIFIESILNAERAEKNILDAKVGMPDYADMDATSAVEDFRKRVAQYQKVYEPLDAEAEVDLKWIKLIDGGRRVVLNRMKGFLPMRIVQFLSNLHLQPNLYYFSRHGQSQYNQHAKIGGDSNLSPAGEEYAKALAKYAEEHICKGGKEKARLWTSSLKRTINTGVG
jgi:hypothetical protein